MDKKMVAKELASIAKSLIAESKGPIWDALKDNWNDLHDIESNLDWAAHKYDVVISYAESKGSEEAKKILMRINQVKKDLEKLSMVDFDELNKLEMDFVKKFGTPEEFVDTIRKQVFPR